MKRFAFGFFFLCLSSLTLAPSRDSAVPAALRLPYFPSIQIHHESRWEHARELMGPHFEKSLPAREFAIEGLEGYILEQTRASLPPARKARAPEIADAVIAESVHYGLDPVFVLALIQRESGFDPLARGSFGEIGLLQLKPGTAEWIAERYRLAYSGPESLENPVANIRLGLAYLDFLRQKYGHHSQLYLSAYNMGPKNVQKLLDQQEMPKEYAYQVMRKYRIMYETLYRKKLLARNGSEAAAGRLN